MWRHRNACQYPHSQRNDRDCQVVPEEAADGFRKGWGGLFDRQLAGAGNVELLCRGRVGFPVGVTTQQATLDQINGDAGIVVLIDGAAGLALDVIQQDKLLFGVGLHELFP